MDEIRRGGADAKITMRKFIIFAPSYDEKIGGSMVLHQLAALLDESGHDVRLWPIEKPMTSGWGVWRTILWHVRELARRVIFASDFKRAPGSRVQMARRVDIEGAVVVYPEVVYGNPLRATKVVRWLLHKPGFLTGKIGFTASELHFYYQKAFDVRFEGAHSGGELALIKIFSDIYKNENKGVRKGRAYILKKGADRAAGLDLSDGIVIDRLSHQEIAKIFNQVEYCISYDPHTYYSVYAAMCGCKSVIVPTEGVSKEQWQPVEELRYGLAYGENDVEHAVRTLPQMLALWSAREAANRSAVDNFVRQCDAYFG